MNNNNDLREFLLVLRRALLLIVAYIEKKYMVDTPPTRKALPRPQSRPQNRR